MPLSHSSQQSILRPRRPNLECRRRQCRTIRRHRRRNAQTRQTPPYHTSREIQKRLHSRLTIRVAAQRYVSRRRD
jgi:hypothetical protein